MERQIGKQCKPVQVHSFSRFSLRCNLRKFACWDKRPQSPLNGICDTGCNIFKLFQEICSRTFYVALKVSFKDGDILGRLF